MSGQNDTEGDDELFGYDQAEVDGEMWVHCPGCDKHTVRHGSDKHAMSKEQTHRMINCPNCGFGVYETGLLPLSELGFDPTVEPEFEIEFSEEARELLGGDTDHEEEDEEEEN